MCKSNELCCCPRPIERNNFTCYIAYILILNRSDADLLLRYRIYFHRGPINRPFTKILEGIVHIRVNRAVLPSYKIAANKIPVFFDEQKRMAEENKLLQFQI